MENKKLLKTISVFLTSALVCLCFSGCKKPVLSSKKPSGTSIVNAMDFMGATIRVLNEKIKESKGAEGYADKGFEGTKMTERINDIQKKFNCKIQYVGNGTKQVFNTLNTSILMGEPTADIASVWYDLLVQSVEKGGLYSILNDYDNILDLENEELWDPVIMKKMCTIDGLTAGVQPTLRGTEIVDNGIVMFFNKSMLERESLWDEYNLYELQKNKQWTWDKLDEIGQKVTKDTDADGLIDQFGLIFNSYTITGLNASNSEGGTQAGLYAVNDKNEPVLLVKEKPQINAMNYMCASGAKGKNWMTAPNFGQDAIEGPRNFFTSAHAAFMMDLGENIKTFYAKKMMDTLGVVAVPIGPDNDTKDYFIGCRGCRPWVIPRGIPKPTNAAYVMKELCISLYTDEEAEIATDAMLSEVIGSEKEIIDTYNMLGKKERMSNSMDSPFIATWWPSFASYQGSFFQIVEDGMTAEALYKVWGDASQKDMNKYWGMVMEGVKKIKESAASKSP